MAKRWFVSSLDPLGSAQGGMQVDGASLAGAMTDRMGTVASSPLGGSRFPVCSAAARTLLCELTSDLSFSPY